MVNPQEPVVKKQLPVRDNLFRIPATSAEESLLLGIHCPICGETVFPSKASCPNCSSKQVEQVTIGPRGTLYSFTIVYQIGPVGYKGPVPYGVVKVEMPEGLRITGYCTENNPANLKTGMNMELFIDKIFEDEKGNEIIGYKFRPIP